MSLIASARFALQGLAYALRHERNLQIQLSQKMIADLRAKAKIE